jgi:DNA-binding NarL/FixJ family response regulator
MPGQCTETRDRKKERGLSVLVVDDHPLVRNGIRSILAGHADMQIVGEASNGIEAIILVEKLHPSIVIMDINMPRMNGIDATARIKTDNPDTIIIGLSANASTENQETMTRAGAARLIPKEKAADLLYDVMHETIVSR